MNGTYAYPDIGSSQWIGSRFALGLVDSFFTSGSSLGTGGGYGVSVLLSSDMGRASLNGLNGGTQDICGKLFPTAEKLRKAASRLGTRGRRANNRDGANVAEVLHRGLLDFQFLYHHVPS